MVDGERVREGLSVAVPLWLAEWLRVRRSVPLGVRLSVVVWERDHVQVWETEPEAVEVTDRVGRGVAVLETLRLWVGDPEGEQVAVGRAERVGVRDREALGEAVAVLVSVLL